MTRKIAFHEEDTVSPSRTFQAPGARPRSGLITRLVLRTGVVKDERQASFLLVGIITLCILYFILRALISSSDVTMQSTDLGPGFDPDTGLPYVD